MEDKLFLGFGIITVLSGTALLFQNQYVIGVAGSIVGLWLIIQNIKKIKNQKSE